MNIHEAAQHLTNGGKIKRKHWSNKEIIEKVDDQLQYSKIISQPTPDSESFYIEDEFVCISLSLEDLLALDWDLVVHEEQNV